MVRKSLCAAAAALFMVACGSSSSSSGSSGAALGSCSAPALYSCTDYSGTYSGYGTVQLLCTQELGTYSSSACPTANRIETCTITSSGFTQAIHFYTPAVQAGPSACTGTWTPG